MSIFETIQLTNNSYDDEGPSISGNKVAWSQWDGSTYQVYYYDGANIIPLTDTYFGGQHVKISGDNIVWRSSGFYGVSDIYLYNGKSTIELSDNSYKTNYNGNPQISGNSVIWPSGNEIYLYNGANVIQLPKNDSEKRNTYKDVLDPQISGNNVIWSGWDGTDYEIYLYNGVNTIQLTSNDSAELYPKISGNNVVWFSRDGNDYEIYLYNGISTVQLTNNTDKADDAPQISGNNVVWNGWDGNDYEIYLYNGINTVQLTNNTVPDEYPKISGNNIVWQTFDGNDYEIYAYDGSSILQLTNNNYRDGNYDISGNNIIWQGSDGKDWEIYLAKIITSTITLDDVRKNPSVFMDKIRDYDGNNLGSGNSWKFIGDADAQGDGDMESIFVNPLIGRWATVGVVNNFVDFSKHGQGGDTRVVGIYIDPTLKDKPENIGGPFDSQRRFQNDLRIDNLRLLAAADYNKDGFQDMYFKVVDGTAVLRALMHADGNIQYANYQSKSDLEVFMTANNVSPSIWSGWI